MPDPAQMQIIMKALASASFKLADQGAHIMHALVQNCPTIELHQDVASDMWRASIAGQRHGKNSSKTLS